MSRLSLLSIFVAFSACSDEQPELLDPGPPYPLDDQLRVDHLQMEGTHNSYHIEPDNPIDDSHRYTHVPLYEQLDQQGVRAFELDIHQNEVDGPLSVYHIKINQARIDAETNCELFTDCLTSMREWADINRGHAPIVSWIEVKDDTGGLTIRDLDRFEQEILSVIPRHRLLTPDDVKKDHGSIREALETEGWPLLAEARNKFLFVVMSGDQRELYTHGFTSLDGRVAFMTADPSQFDQPWAAFAKINNPRSDVEIAQAHAARVIVASNVCSPDTDDVECESKLQAGLENGVHMLMDDIPAPVPERAYYLDIPDGAPSRCNPVTAPPACTSTALEDR